MPAIKVICNLLEYIIYQMFLEVQFFYSGFSESPWLDKIGHCACTDVSIAYGGDRFTTFADRTCLTSN